MSSGTKLVTTLAFLALALGVVSWWYRFESAHRSTQFWGPLAAELISTQSQVTASSLTPSTEETGVPDAELLVVDNNLFKRINPHDVTRVPGMVHLRNSLLTDSNYDWNAKVSSPRWRWCLQFAHEGQKVYLLFSEEFAEVGLLENEQSRVVDCQPMSETLQKYAASSQLFDASLPVE